MSVHLCDALIENSGDCDCCKNPVIGSRMYCAVDYWGEACYYACEVCELRIMIEAETAIQKTMQEVFRERYLPSAEGE